MKVVVPDLINYLKELEDQMSNDKIPSDKADAKSCSLKQTRCWCKEQEPESLFFFFFWLLIKPENIQESYNIQWSIGISVAKILSCQLGLHFLLETKTGLILPLRNKRKLYKAFFKFSEDPAPCHRATKFWLFFFFCFFLKFSITPLPFFTTNVINQWWNLEVHYDFIYTRIFPMHA